MRRINAPSAWDKTTGRASDDHCDRRYGRRSETARPARSRAAWLGLREQRLQSEGRQRARHGRGRRCSRRRRMTVSASPACAGNAGSCRSRFSTRTAAAATRTSPRASSTQSNHGADVINLSIAGARATKAVANAVAYALVRRASSLSPRPATRAAGRPSIPPATTASSASAPRTARIACTRGPIVVRGSRSRLPAAPYTGKPARGMDVVVRYIVCDACGRRHRRTDHQSQAAHLTGESPARHPALDGRCEGRLARAHRCCASTPDRRQAGDQQHLDDPSQPDRRPRRPRRPRRQRRRAEARLASAG